MGRMVPVMKLALSELKKRMALAMSSISPNCLWRFRLFLAISEGLPSLRPP